jgi:hypothetical protein
MGVQGIRHAHDIDIKSITLRSSHRWCLKGYGLGLWCQGASPNVAGGAALTSADTGTCGGDEGSAFCSERRFADSEIVAICCLSDDARFGDQIIG